MNFVKNPASTHCKITYDHHENCDQIRMRTEQCFDGFKMCNTDDNSQIADQKQKLHLFIHVPNLLDKIC